MFVIEQYLDTIVANLPPPPKIPIEIDLVMDGGAFNGSYIIGCLYFLKRMEKLKYITVCRISGCSISSFLGLMYLIDTLNILQSRNYYQETHAHFIKHKNLDFLFSVGNFLPEELDVSLLDKRLYITYNNIHTMKRVVVNKFKNKKHLCDCIIRSSFVPYIINGDLLYKNKYLDGILPYLFHSKKNRKLLYLNLITFEKIPEMLNVKNESTNYGRILYGIIDIHLFYIKSSSTEICSYINNWNVIHHATYLIKVCILICIRYLVYLVNIFHKHYPNRFLKIIVQEILHTFL